MYSLYYFCVYYKCYILNVKMEEVWYVLLVGLGNQERNMKKLDTTKFEAIDKISYSIIFL